MMNRIALQLCLTLVLLFAPGVMRSQQRNILNAHKLSEWQYYETSLQYAPVVMYAGLEYLGARTEQGIADRAIALGTTSVFLVAVVNLGFKNLVHEQRPDGTSFNSFPSGHTALAFAGADLVRRSYGWEWGTACYAVATAVAVGRVAHGRHWWWDCVAGAGVGIGCAYLGTLCINPVKRLFGIEEDSPLSIFPSLDPASGALCASLSCRF